MVRDYSERRQMRTNQPKRPSVWPYVLLIVVLMVLAYLAGAATGWYLYRPGGRFYKTPLTAAPAAVEKKSTALPPQGDPIVPAPAPPSTAGQQPQQHQQNPGPGQPPPAKGSGAPPLSFYNTLQKGNKGLIGTGINQPKEGQQSPPPQSPPLQQPER